MKVEVDKIKDTPLKVNEVVSVKDWDMDRFDVKFIDDLYLDCEFRRIHDEILLNSDITIKKEITCSRCLSQVSQTDKQKYQNSYNVNSLGEVLDIDKDIREDVLLNFPLKILCKPDCKGLCPGCGINLNTEECKCKDKK